jgi:hypothetical protein
MNGPAVTNRLQNSFKLTCTDHRIIEILGLRPSNRSPCLLLEDVVLLTVGCPIFPFYIDSQISVHRKYKKIDQLIFRNAKEIYFNEKFPIL